AAALDKDARQKKLDRATQRGDVPLAEALRYLAREALDGQPPPPSAEKAADFWRDWVAGRIGPAGLSRLDAALADQALYARLVAGLLEAIDMQAHPASPAEDSPDEAGDNSDDNTGDDAEPDTGMDESAAPEQASGAQDTDGQDAEM